MCASAAADGVHGLHARGADGGQQPADQAQQQGDAHGDPEQGQVDAEGDRLRSWVLRKGVPEVCALLEVHTTNVYAWIRQTCPALPREKHRRQLEDLMGLRRRRAS